MQTQTNPLQKRIFRISLALCLTSFFLALFTIHSYWREKSQALEKRKIEARAEAKEAAKKIEKKLEPLQKSVITIADDLTAGKLKDQQLHEKLKRTIQDNPEIYGITAAYAHRAFNPELELYSPYYVRVDGKPVLRQRVYDYTQDEEEDWYTRIKEQGGPIWLEPYFGSTSEALITAFGIPFYRIDPKSQKKVPSGVVRGNYSTEGLKGIMSELKLGSTGYGLLLSKKGTFIHSPRKDWIENQKNIYQIGCKESSKKKSCNPWILAAEKAFKGSRSETNFDNPLTGQKSWIIFEPIPSTGWTLAAVFIEDEILVDTNSLRSKLILIDLELITFFFFLFVLLFRAYQGSVRSLWAVSSATSVVLMTGIGFIWYLELNQYQIQQSKNVVLLDKKDVDKFLQSHHEKAKKTRKSSRQKPKKPLQIPTGVFVQSLEFEDANNIYITGYIWQKYDKDYDNEIHKDSPGFIFPEAVDSNVTEIYRHLKGDSQVIGWYFETKLRQNFNYDKYPFDVKHVWIRLWHKDFSQNTVLVPDFDAYDLILPSFLPGLEKDFVLPGWNLQSSFFQYKSNNYNTNFGIDNYSGQYDFPELYFTVIIKRDFITIFISNMMIIIVVLLLLFCVQILIIKNKKNSENFDFTPLEIVSACGAFLFIIIIDQINLRQKIITAGIIYFDYFYFVLYVFLLLVAINAILFASNIKLNWIHYKNNLISKLLYWPGNLTLILLVTLLVFGNSSNEGKSSSESPEVKTSFINPSSRIETDPKQSAITRFGETFVE